MEKTGYTYKYPHPSVTADCVVFGYEGKKLHILLIERRNNPYKGHWALPGGFMEMDETIEECASRELAEETGINGIRLEQFHIFSEVDRDPRERVLSVAFLALVRKADYNVTGRDDAARAEWFSMEDLPSLAFDHAAIIGMAITKLQNMLKIQPLAFRLFDMKFTIGEIQRVYETINGTKYDRRNFQKKLL